MELEMMLRANEVSRTLTNRGADHRYEYARARSAERRRAQAESRWWKTGRRIATAVAGD